MQDRELQIPLSDHFRYKELKVYSSVEWLSDNKKKYRQVFDRMETDYIYAELSIYNKYFDIDSWEVDIILKCYEEGPNPKAICTLSFRKKISKYDPVVFIREGWGNKREGSFWKGGSYYWEAFVDNVSVGTKPFYIVDTGIRNKDTSNYLSILDLRFYEGHYDDMTDAEKKYCHGFAAEHSRYIFTEISFKNQLMSRQWPCEIFVRYYNEAGEIKANIARMHHVAKNEKKFELVAGFGSNTKGNWQPGVYRIEIGFLNTQIATSYFEIGEDFKEGRPVVYIDKDRLLNRESIPKEHIETYEDVILKLDRLIGLSEVKNQVRDHALYLKFLGLRKEKGFDDNDPHDMHTVYMGNPGTGKTTVAKMMGMLYHKMGLLSKGHVHEVDRVDLVGEYIGQTAPKVKDAIEKARGGVLFIDEAYALARTSEDNKDFGKEAIEVLVKEMSNGKKDLVVIVAGYPKEMKTFINSNPGLKSRFKHFFEFKDYMPQELIEIGKLACSEKKVVFNEAAQSVFESMIVRAYRNRDATFGNARFVYDLVEKAKINMGIRIMSKDINSRIKHQDLKTIIKKDLIRIEEAQEKVWPSIPIDVDLLEESLNELDAMIGMQEVKKQITEIVEVCKYYKGIGKNILESFFLHTVFIGNPGTGKTSVARILTKIYKAMGILERGHMVETDRQGLIAGFVGQTAIKTAERIEEAMGGVLFIDEAYALSNFNGLQGDYGNEAIQTLLKKMEDNRGRFFVFAAGYPENMEKFLKANPGLNSRFDKVLHFADYTTSELMEIAIKMIGDEGLHFSTKAKIEMEKVCTNMYLTRDKYFGNARDVRKFIAEVVKEHNLRLASSINVASVKGKNSIITHEDILKVMSTKMDDIFNKKRIGFNA